MNENPSVPDENRTNQKSSLYCPPRKDPTFAVLDLVAPFVEMAVHELAPALAEDLLHIVYDGLDHPVFHREDHVRIAVAPHILIGACGHEGRSAARSDTAGPRPCPVGPSVAGVPAADVPSRGREDVMIVSGVKLKHHVRRRSSQHVVDVLLYEKSSLVDVS